MNNLIAYLQLLSKKPAFVAFRGLFIGALIAELSSAYQAGHIDLSFHAVSQMIVDAVVVAVIALWHLYTPKPNSVKNAESERSNEK